MSRLPSFVLAALTAGPVGARAPAPEPPQVRELGAVAANLPAVPGEVARVGDLFRAEIRPFGVLSTLLLMSLFIGSGVAARGLCWLLSDGPRRRLIARPLDTVRDRLVAMGIRLACMANATTATILGSIGPFLLFVVVAIPFAIGQVHRAVGHILRPPGTEADPEMGPTIMETLKMQGVEAFGDFAIQIRLKIMTRPGEQFVIRRKAMAMVRQTFQENGIEFAFPKILVDVGGPA